MTEKIIATIPDKAGAVKNDNDSLEMKLIDLEGRKMPRRYRVRFDHMSEGQDLSKDWLQQEQQYRKLVFAYYRILIALVEYKEAAAIQDYDTFTASEAKESHEAILELLQEIESQIPVFEQETEHTLTNLSQYIDKEIEYRTKNIDFYEADAAKKLSEEQNLRDELVDIQDELNSVDPFTGLEVFEEEVLALEKEKLQEILNNIQ